MEISRVSKTNFQVTLKDFVWYNGKEKVILFHNVTPTQSDDG